MKIEIAWGEVAIGFAAIAYTASQAFCQGAFAMHGLSVVLVSVPVFIYAVVKGVYCTWKALSK